MQSYGIPSNFVGINKRIRTKQGELRHFVTSQTIEWRQIWKRRTKQTELLHAVTSQIIEWRQNEEQKKQSSSMLWRHKQMNGVKLKTSRTPPCCDVTDNWMAPNLKTKNKRSRASPSCDVTDIYRWEYWVWKRKNKTRRLVSKRDNRWSLNFSLLFYLSLVGVERRNSIVITTTFHVQTTAE